MERLSPPELSHARTQTPTAQYRPSADHRNLNKDDDRLANLRLASPAQNSANNPGRNAASGRKGVYRNGRSGWMSRIMANGTGTYLGTFASKEEAATAYAEASARLHGEFGRT